MFCVLNDALDLITSFSSNHDLTTEKKNFVRTLKYDKFEFVLNLLNNQNKILDKEYALYKLNYGTFEFNHISDIYSQNHKEYHTVIDSTDDCLILNILSPQYLSNYIYDNYDMKYIFLPLNYGSHVMDTAHQSCIMIDMHNKTIYMLDPNGQSTYLDSVLCKSNTNEYVEYALSKYTDLLKIYGLDYKYEHAHQWNPNNYAINKWFANEYIGRGHCVVTTLMIIHLIAIHNFTPMNVFEKLSNLSEDELLYIIKEYTMGIYNLLNN